MERSRHDVFLFFSFFPFSCPSPQAAGGRRQVPLLVVDGTPIEDSTAILQYLDGLLPTPSLYPADLKEDISRWEHTLNKKLGSLARKLIYSHRLATPSLDKALMAEAPVVERMLYAVGAKYLVCVYMYVRPICLQTPISPCSSTPTSRFGP